MHVPTSPAMSLCRKLCVSVCVCVCVHVHKETLSEMMLTQVIAEAEGPGTCQVHHLAPFSSFPYSPLARKSCNPTPEVFL